MTHGYMSLTSGLHSRGQTHGRLSEPPSALHASTLADTSTSSVNLYFSFEVRYAPNVRKVTILACVSISAE
jgi:hypothetical protein